MPTYNHTCTKCDTTTELSISIAEYGEMEEDFGRSDRGNVRFPCDEEGCGGWSERDYSFGVASFKVKGGYKYSTKAYRADAEHEWMKREIENTKGTLLGKKDETSNSDYNTQRPYAGYTLDEKGAEDMGFKRVSNEEAKARAEMSKKTSGDAVAKVDKARKSDIIED